MAAVDYRRHKSPVRWKISTVPRVLSIKGLTLIGLVIVFCFLLFHSYNWREYYKLIRLQEWGVYRWRCGGFLNPSFLSPVKAIVPAAGTGRFMSHAFHPKVGLGNLLFIYASLWGISHKNDMTLVIRHTKLHEIMQLDTAPSPFGGFNLSDCGNFIYGMEECCLYDKTSERLAIVAPSQNVSMWGYFQSFRYFHPQFQQDIRRQFKFKPAIYDKAEELLNKAVVNADTTHFAGGEISGRPNRSVVGIHIRRGDVLRAPAVQFGHTVATKEYYVHALEYMNSHGVVDPVYVVCTNDLAWAKENIVLPRVFFIENQGPDVDLAVLTMADYLVLSVGTYSFFAGYLSDAKIITYYSNWPATGSDFAKMLNVDDFWLPEWIPLK